MVVGALMHERAPAAKPQTTVCECGDERCVERRRWHLVAAATADLVITFALRFFASLVPPAMHRHVPHTTHDVLHASSVITTATMTTSGRCSQQHRPATYMMYWLKTVIERFGQF